MMPRLVRKTMLLIGATAVTASAFVAMPTPASAAESIQAVALLPYCVTAADSPGRSATLCINSITSSSMPGYSTSESVTGSGSLRVCTSTYSCTNVPLTINSTGVGLNPSSALPSITSTGSTTVNLTQFCYKTTCTPGSVNVPTYNITLFPTGTPPLERVCVDGICSAPVLTPVVVSEATTNTLVAALTAS